MANPYKGLIRLVLFDVDGVLTNGTLSIGSEGELVKNFNVKDGVAVALLRSHGIRCGIISGKESAALAYRSKELSFDVVIMGCHDKLAAYQKVKRDLCIHDPQIAFVGDDVIDLPVMRLAGTTYAPADAHTLVLRHAHHVTSKAGGQGVAREVAEHILVSGGLSLDDAYQPLLDEWTCHAVVQ